MWMCWECGGNMAVNLRCNHDNPNPERLQAALAQYQRENGGQLFDCPDCMAQLSASIGVDGVIRVVFVKHRI